MQITKRVITVIQITGARLAAWLRTLPRENRDVAMISAINEATMLIGGTGLLIVAIV